MIKSFRRSKRLSNSSDSKQNISRVLLHLRSDELALLQSPKKVIKALYDYDPQGPGELKFEKGDFFHVLSDSQDGDGWYEATNPMTHARGMVPVSYFEVFNRSRPVAENAPQQAPQQAPIHRNSSQTLYAVTVYAFKAERDDELDVEEGENLIICAHHDYEWFIAKPINRLGGPGLVPSLYVKIIDLVNPANTPSADTSMVDVINTLRIPTVEQWKDQTARYQALTIPLGSILNQTAPVSLNSQYFQRELGSNRLSLSLSKTTIVEASVDTYQLDHGRYQYLVVARLSNGRVRHLYRYYQDFYDLQVKLLELFPYEAGKIENSRRIIPSIPGPLINVNDSISKLRREKLDYYLRNLVALPLHILRLEDVLALFEVLENGVDREMVDTSVSRTSKPISQKSNYQQDRLSQYLGFHNLTNANRTSTTPTSLDLALHRSLSSSSNLATAPTAPSTAELKLQKVKVKFYYDDDIFVLLLPTNLRLQDLKAKLGKRLNLDETEHVLLFLKNDYDDFVDENNIVNEDFDEEARAHLRPFEIDSDDRFHGTLYDKCKIVILT